MRTLVAIFRTTIAQMDKGRLDMLLESHKAQPVGHGYIDIIVSRENYKAFVEDLVLNGYKIESLSWWEWCPGDKKNEYGLGGPRSRYYDGWFSELSVQVDDIELPEDDAIQIEKLISAIENKSISFSNERVMFKQHTWLTPGIWLNVPDEWRNQYFA
jgi:hypothetical protein